MLIDPKLVDALVDLIRAATFIACLLAAGFFFRACT
jgi:hypothetical protein